MQLLTFQNAKTVKGEAKGYLTAIMYLAPYNTSGVNLCPKASPGCIAACLFTAGRGAFNNVRQARINRSKFFTKDKRLFLAQLKLEICKAELKAHRKGMQLSVRLNGTSDIAWEGVSNIIQKFDDIQFYDYTKRLDRALNNTLSNYDLTFSLTESNQNEAKQALSKGVNVAAVFHKLPKAFLNYPVINGDETDLRFLDKKGVIVGLKAKGKARKDLTGFVY